MTGKIWHSQPARSFWDMLERFSPNPCSSCSLSPPVVITHYDLNISRDDSGSCGWLGKRGWYAVILAITWLNQRNEARKVLGLSDVIWHSPTLQRTKINHYLLFIQIRVTSEHITGVLLNIYQILSHNFRITFLIDYGYCNITVYNILREWCYNLFKRSALNPKPLSNF